MARDRTKTARRTERGCALALADVTDTETLVRAFAGADGVFILILPIFDPSPDFAEVRAVIAAVRAALDVTRPGRVVILSPSAPRRSAPTCSDSSGWSKASWARSIYRSPFYARPGS